MPIVPTTNGIILVPSSIDFGSALGAENQTLQILCSPNAGGNVTVTGVTFPGGSIYSSPTSFPLTITPGNVGNITITKASNASLSSSNITVNVTLPGVGSSFFITQLGNPTASTTGTDSITFTQASFTLSENLGSLVNGTFIQNWVINNNSANTATITDINVFNSIFTFTGIAVGTTIPPSSSVTVAFTCTLPQLGFQDGFAVGSSELFGITFSTSGGLESLVGTLSYYGVPIVSVNNLVNIQSQLIVGLAVNSVKQMDPTNLNTEEDCSWSRQFDFGTPGFQKFIGRLYTRLENKGSVTLTANLTTTNGDNKSVTQTPVFTVASGNLQGFLWDLISNGELCNLTVTRPLNSGSLSLTLYGFLFEERGEVYEGQ